MKNILSILLFLGFLILCGAEIGPKFLSTAQKESGAVLYSASAKEGSSQKQEAPKKVNYQKLVEEINANGA